jgi:hypothetical protein
MTCLSEKRDRSAENRHGECRIAPSGNQIAQTADVERDVDRQPDGLDRVDARSLELVEAPLEDDVGSRPLDARTNRRCSGCRSDHGEAIGSSAMKLELGLVRRLGTFHRQPVGETAQPLPGQVKTIASLGGKQAKRCETPF